MLLKPIPPTKYTGEPSANAFSRFVREGSAYVKMGRVKPADQVFFLSYYLDGKASDFYNQVVVRDEDSYTLETFFKELFDFCFPQDFRNKQRKRLNRCYQNGKSVAEHVAEFAQIYDTIGALEGQEKIVKLWNDDELKREFGENAQKFISHQVSYERHYGILKDIYSNLNVAL